MVNMLTGALALGKSYAKNLIFLSTLLLSLEKSSCKPSNKGAEFGMFSVQLLVPGFQCLGGDQRHLLKQPSNSSIVH